MAAQMTSAWPWIVPCGCGSLAGWPRGAVCGVGTGMPGSGNKQEAVSFLPVFVPMAAGFLWEESCAFCSEGKRLYLTGRDKAANAEGRELKALLDEAWDEEGAR